MTFASIAPGAAIFLDANTLIYHFSSDPKHGPACTQLMQRIERQDVAAFTSSDVLTDLAHRLMTLEAIQRFGWPATGIASRLRKNRTDITKLTRFRQALLDLPQSRIQVFPITQALVGAAAFLSQQHALLTGDALVVAVMQANGLSDLASADPDFDTVPGLRRYSPI
ncbi:MAG: type II toxin-antitoxin system VapC family toxin [Gemmataceae bacterium]